MDDDGFVTVVDRIKELIITGGFNVYPSEVEDALRRVPGVADAAVVGLPNDTGGETVVAAVVAEGFAVLDPDAVRDAVRETLTGYKVPRQVFVLDELPRSLIGKVLHREVRAILETAPRPPLTRHMGFELLAGGQGGEAALEVAALGWVGHQAEGSRVRRPRGGVVARATQELGADRVREVVAVEVERVDEGQRLDRVAQLGDRDGAVERHDR